MFSLSFFSDYPDLLATLLINHANSSTIIGNTSTPEKQASDTTFIKQIKPRIKKSETKKKARTKAQAEVFTPAWLCNQQNNLIDSRWFNGESPFNKETPKGWQTSNHIVSFPKGKTWQDYIATTRLEICCGEAPYLTSRYDATTGVEISATNRIGLFDRKLRVVSENTVKRADWEKYAIQALKSVFGYEKSGDSLLIARINIFFSFLDFYQYKFNLIPAKKILVKVATIISWNLWQMDCMNEESVNQAILMDWGTGKKTTFKSLLKQPL